MVLLRLEKHVFNLRSSTLFTTYNNTLFFPFLPLSLLPLFLLSQVDFPLEGLDLSTYVGGMPGVDQVTIYHIYYI